MKNILARLYQHYYDYHAYGPPRLKYMGYVGVISLSQLYFVRFTRPNPQHNDDDNPRVAALSADVLRRELGIHRLDAGKVSVRIAHDGKAAVERIPHDRADAQQTFELRLGFRRERSEGQVGLVGGIQQDSAKGPRERDEARAPGPAVLRPVLRRHLDGDLHRRQLLV